MTALLWGAFGMALGSAVLHFALAVRRPFDRTYASFAFLMLFLAAYVYFEYRLYRSSSAGEAVEAMRMQLLAAHGYLACTLVFVPAYTRMRIPPKVMITCWVTLAVMVVLNLVLPDGVWLSGPPRLVTAVFRSEIFSEVIAPPMGIVQFAHAAFIVLVFAITLACALHLFRRGERQRAATLGAALLIGMLYHLLDIVHDAVGGTWPYLSEYGLVTWGLIMSVQLALDFRTTGARLTETLHDVEEHTAELAAMVDAALVVRDKLNTPLQTLELGLALYTGSPQQAATLAELRDAVDELTALGRAVERTAQAPPKEPPG